MLVRVWHVAYGLPDVYHPDEARIVTRAVRFHTGDLNPHFFNWPSLSMYLLAGLYGLAFGMVGAGGVVEAFLRDPGAFYVLGRLVTAVSGSGTIAVLYLLGAEAYGRVVGLLAALFLAVDLLHVHDSQFVTTDVPLTLLVALAMLFTLRYWREGRLRHALASGLFTGLATSMKYPGALMLLPFTVALLCREDRAGERGGPRWRRLASADALGAGAAAVLGFVAGTPYALLTPGAFVRGVLAEAGEVRTVQFGNEGDLPGLMFHLTHSLPVAMGAPLALLALVGLGIALSTRRARDAVLLAFPVPYLFVIGTWSSRFERYAVPLLPFAALLAALALVVLTEAAGRRLPLRGRVGPGFCLAGLVVALLAPGLDRLVLFHGLLARPDTRVVAAGWIEREVPAGTRIALEPYGPSLPVAAALLREAPEEAATDLAVPVFPGLPAGGAVPATGLGQVGYWIVRLNRYDLDGLRRRGVGYVVLSGFVFHRHQRACDRYPEPCRFYRELDREATLVYAVDGGVDDRALWVGDIYAPLTRLHERLRPGPAIRIYRLTPAAAGSPPA